MFDKQLQPQDSQALVRSELILGGQKSGKSRRAEALARHWMDASAGHRAVLLATATASDAEMSERIQRHQQDRARHSPGLQCVEVPLALPEAITRHSDARTLLVVDCLTLWLTNILWPPSHGAGHGQGQAFAAHAERPLAALRQAMGAASGPLVLVGNEIGLGVIPMGPAVRTFVDALGQLNQSMAQACDRVTFMVAGLPLRVKGD